MAEPTRNTMSRRRIRPSYKRPTPFASTSAGPSRSRVRNVDAMPRRPLSRNSTIVACVPTATISAAPASYAMSRAASSLIPSATNSSYFTPAAVHVVDELRAAVHRAVAERVEVTDDDVGLLLDVEQRVGAAIDRDEHR